MSIKGSIELVGVPEMLEALEAVSKRVANAAMRDALEQAAPIIVNAAKSHIDSDTGALKDSITYKLVHGRGKGRFGYAIIGPASKAVYQTSKGVRKPSRYAHLIELGVAPHSLQTAVDMKPIRRALGVFYRLADEQGGSVSTVRERARQFARNYLARRDAKKHPGHPAKPFLRPAVDESRGAVFDLMGKVIEQHVRDEAKKQFRRHQRKVRRMRRANLPGGRRAA